MTDQPTERPTLRLNSHGQFAREAITALNRLGYDIPDARAVTPEVREGIKAFQRDNHLEVSGLVDETTWRYLDDALDGLSDE